MGFHRSGGFKAGDEIEVSCDEEGFHGAWYEAIVARRFHSTRRLSIVYAKLLSDSDPSKQLQETVDISHVRPRPRRSRERAFEVFQLVEGYHKAGWWPGVVVGVSRERCLIRFPSTREQLELPVRKVRPRLHWVKGQWIAAGAEGSLEEKFNVGTQVEVTRDKEIYGAAWFPGRVVKLIGDTYFLVEYENLRPNGTTCTDDSEERMREIVDAQYMRPPPPDIAYGRDFRIQDEVEVLDQGTWLAGFISKIILSESKYVVKLKYQKLEEEVELSELRLRSDWTDGQWICVSMGNCGKSVPAGKTMSIDGCQKPGIGGSSQVQNNKIIPNESSEPLSDDMMLTCKGTLRQNQVSKLQVRKRTMTEPQLAVVMAKRKKSDGSDVEGQCKDPPPQKTSYREETTLLVDMEEQCHSESYLQGKSSISVQSPQCHSESYLQGKSTISIQSPLESPPDSTSSGSLYDQFKRGLYEVTGTPDLLTAEMGNHENNSGTNLVTRKRRKKLAVRNPGRLRKSLDLGVGDEPAEEERIEGTGRPLKRCANLEKASGECEQVHIEKSAELVVETENVRTEIELRPPNPFGYLNNKMESAVRNEFATAIGDITGDPSETCVSADRMKILDSSTLPKTYSARSKPRESMGNVTQYNINEAMIEANKDKPIIHQEEMPDWLALKGTTIVDKDGVLGELLTCNSTGKEHVLPFEKNSVMWEPLESMEIFRKMPQQPHFRDLEQYCKDLREGMAIGFMVTFTNLINDISKLCINDPTEVFMGKLEALLALEANGFHVQCLRSRIEKLLEIRENLNQHKMKKDSLEEQISERNNENALYDAVVAELDRDIPEVEKTLTRLNEKRTSTIMIKQTNDSEIVNMQMDLQTSEGAYRSAEHDFRAAVGAPWW